MIEFLTCRTGYKLPTLFERCFKIGAIVFMAPEVRIFRLNFVSAMRKCKYISYETLKITNATKKTLHGMKYGVIIIFCSRVLLCFCQLFSKKFKTDT